MAAESEFAPRCDVAIVGGGSMGSSLAYFLAMRSPGTAVTVIERDPTYEFCSSLRASGGCRVQFSCPENIEMSKFSIDFIRAFPETMRTATHEAPIDWVEGGYLLLAHPGEMGLLEANCEVQRLHGCESILLDPQALKERFPSMRVDDLAGGVHTPRDGWCDPNGMLQGFRRKALSLGVHYVADAVTGFERSGPLLRSARLASGRSIAAQHFVNAAGPWAGEVAAMAGVVLPVEPLRRFEHYFTPGVPMERLPLVKDLQRMAFRSEGVGFSGGVVDSDEPRGFNFEVDHDYFERVVWPHVAHRFPPLQSAKCHRTWSGLYEQCELDGNPIIGNWPGHLENLYHCAGFSGHGLMHAPAVGRALAELILAGRYETIDLARLGYARVAEGRPYPERGIL